MAKEKEQFETPQIRKAWFSFPTQVQAKREYKQFRSCPCVSQCWMDSSTRACVAKKPALTETLLDSNVFL